MQLTLIKNPDESKIVLYKIAKIIYAETNCSSLYAIEAMASMIFNQHIRFDRKFEDLMTDNTIFESLNKDSVRYKDLFVNNDDKNFQICIRTARKMMNGDLPDSCSGAVRFHNINNMPDWALSKGYIAEIDNLLFYL